MAITNVPNNGEFSRNRANNGSVPLSRDASPIRTGNERFKAGDPGGSGSLAKSASPINPPNDAKFRDGDPGRTPAAPSAIEPGKGAVPVNPFLKSGGIAPASVQADEATMRLVRGR
jgi:hypothetical protein